MRGAVKSVMVTITWRGSMRFTKEYLVSWSRVASTRHRSFENCSHGRAMKLYLLRSTHGDLHGFSKARL